MKKEKRKKNTLSFSVGFRWEYNIIIIIIIIFNKSSRFLFNIVKFLLILKNLNDKKIHHWFFYILYLIIIKSTAPTPKFFSPNSNKIKLWYQNQWSNTNASFFWWIVEKNTQTNLEKETYPRCIYDWISSYLIASKQGKPPLIWEWKSSKLYSSKRTPSDW